MAWQPQEEPVRQLSGYLKDSLSGHNKNAQKQAEIVCVNSHSQVMGNNSPKVKATITNLSPFLDACTGKVLPRHQQLPDISLFEFPGSVGVIIHT